MECSIIQILRAVEGGRISFSTLDAPRFRHFNHGELFYRVGNSAIIFNIWHDGRWRNLKCYTASIERRKIIYGDKLLESEIYIPIDERRGVWLDVLLDDWVEGMPLSDYLKQRVETSDNQALQKLSKDFDSLALDLLSSESAHGDITCENIIVDPSGELHLIDFDNAFTPELTGEQSIELGTEAYQHPLRSVDNFDRTIDDYSLALISTSLSLIALDATIYKQYNHIEGLLFDPRELVEQRNELLSFALTLFERQGAILEYRIAMMLTSQSCDLPDLHYLLRYKVEGVSLNAQPSELFCRGGLWGYLNEFGREVIPPLFDSALNFSESFAAVKIGTTWH